MQKRREVLVAFAGAIALAGCAGQEDDQIGEPEETATDEDGEPTADEAESNRTSQNNGENETNGEDDSENDPDCATTVTIESGAMEPNLSKGDEVCVVQYESYRPVDDPEETGIITVETGEKIGYEKLGGNGDVIRYYQDGDEEVTPVFARVVKWEDGSYVTKGDANSDPYPWEVPVEWIIGVVRTTLE